MIASLGMYDRAETAAANDRFWAGIRDGLRARAVAAPEALTRGDRAYWPAWEDGALVFSQTCGYPFRSILHDKVTLIATPDHGLPGCPPGYYQSIFVARAGDPRESLPEFEGADFAFNEDLSQSGWAGPVNHLTRLGLLPRPRLRTGGHVLSAQAVIEKRVDYAALDALTWAIIQTHDSFATGLKVIGRTPPTPALPYIAAKGADRAATLAALQDAVAALSDQDRATLHLRGIVEIPAADYLVVPNPEAPRHFGMPD
jgi:ABC-type phosphate/phosphonate transport system substrate-binding protein